ncbi:flagellin [Clostridium sporogenes]|uniref:flagellin N-terminal helical domain-containing protein n=1 Tax=Clostridium sporogenes TaxID=1509 RepID=UPI0013D2E36B|nr:flagellin [Clostridium sporogenes]MBU5300044.1 flagellin [Clostridium sporogenes]NFP91719.1 flagellin [Clostridium sporogenes]
MIINHNLNAMNAHRQMGMNTVNSGKSMEKLSSGLRINRAGDDAAGLAISEKMRGQIRGLDQAGRNSQDAISMIQTGEGALNETHSILQRMRELAVQAGNDTNEGTDRGEIQKEINQLTSEINRIGNTTEFNNQKILNASNGTVDKAVNAVAGEMTTKVDVTGDVTIDGTKFTFDNTATVDGKDGNKFKDLATLVVAINTNAATKDVYKAAVSTADLKLTQNVGSSEVAKIKDSTGTLKVAFDKNKEGKTAEAAKSSFTMQVGANENQTMTLEFADMRSAALGITGTADSTGFTKENTVTDGTNNTTNEAALDVSDSTNAGNAITKIQNAINKVSAERSKLGAYQNRLEHTINNLGTSSENLSAAESRIRDVDMAKEMMNFSKNNILSQAAQAMLAQANQAPQGVLQLLR